MSRKRKVVAIVLAGLALTGCNNTEEVGTDDVSETSSVVADNHGDTFTKATTSTTEQTTSHKNILDIIGSEPEEIPTSEANIDMPDNLIDISNYIDYAVDKEKLKNVDCKGVSAETTGYITMIGREWSDVLAIFCDICHTNNIDVRELSREGSFKYADNYNYTVISLSYNKGVISLAILSDLSEAKYIIEED